jgi:integrase
MTREIDKLSDPEVRTAKAKEKAYKLADGKGLYLEVKPNGGKYWRFKFRFGGKEKLLAIGVYPEVTLKTARKLANEAREKLSQNIDPSEQRRQAKIAQTLSNAASFQSIALEWYGRERGDWSQSHLERVLWILEKILFPYIGHRPIADITPHELLAALRRTESQGKLETTNRAKIIAGQVFRYAVATGRAERDPTPDLKGALKTSRTKHLAAITEPKEVGKLLLAMDGYKGTHIVKSALLLSPLLFCRPGELRQLEWTEIDFDEERINIPVEKMKTREQPHIIPLSKQAIKILSDIQPLTGRGKYVFPSPRGASRPLSDNAVRLALRTLGYDKETMTAHGFRAMARTILDEVLNYRVDWIEHQLAHAVKDVNGRAYNRTAHLEGRKEMMQGWADYLDTLRAVARGENVIAPNFNRKT